MGNVPTPDDHDRDIRRARAEGYVEGLSDVLDLARPVRHAWSIGRDLEGQQFVFTCTCGHEVVQLFGAPIPCELISHPQSFGQMRGE